MRRSPFRSRRSSFTAASAIFGAAAVSIGCNDGAPGSSAAGSRISVRDSAGVEVVQNGRVAVEQAPTLSMLEVQRIGVLEGPEEYQFVSIGAVEEAPDGSILVLDSRAHLVRVFSSSGEFVRQIGREGDGPGELRFPGLLAVAGDTVAVVSYGRVTFFVDGEPHVTHTDADPQTRVHGIGHTPRGWFAGMLETGYPMGESSTRGGPFVDTLRIGPLDPDSREPRLLGTLVRLPGPETHLVGSLGWILTPLFSRTPGYTIAADGRTYFTPGDDYVVDVVDPNGEHLRRIVADVEKIPVTRGDVDAYLDRRREAIGPSPTGESRTWLDEVPRAYPDIPLLPFRPIPGRILASPSGRVLVRRLDRGPAPVEDWDQDAVWDLFDGDGRIAGRLSVPQNVRPLELTDDVLWTVTRDELDVQYVTSYRIETAGDPAEEPPA